jgi:hypothetical protein
LVNTLELLNSGTIGENCRGHQKKKMQQERNPSPFVRKMKQGWI